MVQPSLFHVSSSSSSYYYVAYFCLSCLLAVLVRLSNNNGAVEYLRIAVAALFTSPLCASTACDFVDCLAAIIEPIRLISNLCND